MEKLKKYYLEESTEIGWGNVGDITKEKKDLLKKWLVGKTVLDVGCAVGNYVHFLQDLGYEAKGVDFVDEFLVKARKTGKGGFIKAEATHLPFKDNSFDTALLIDILEHLEKDELALKEAARVVRNRIIVFVPQGPVDIMTACGLTYHHFVDRSHLRVYTVNQIKKLFTNCGLKIISLSGFAPVNLAEFFRLSLKRKAANKMIRPIMRLADFKQYDSQYLVVADKVTT